MKNRYTRTFYLFNTQQEEEDFRRRSCSLCNTIYRAKYITETHTLCNECLTPTRKHELQRIKKHLRRAEKAGNPAALTLKQWLKILDYFQWKCAYCSNTFQILEHVISIADGGGTTNLNCVPACLGCNSGKVKSNTDPMPQWKIDYAQQQLEQIAKEDYE